MMFILLAIIHSTQSLLITGPSKVAYPGDSFTFNCTTDTISNVNWFKDGVVDVVSRGYVRGPDDPPCRSNPVVSSYSLRVCGLTHQLTVKFIDFEEHNGQWLCGIPNSLETFHLEVKREPELLNDKSQEYYINTGNVFNINVTLYSKWETQLTWYHNGIPVSDEHVQEQGDFINHPYNEGVVIPVTTAILKIDSVSKNYTGIYSCRACNIYGCSNSSNTLLIALGEPVDSTLIFGITSAFIVLCCLIIIGIMISNCKNRRKDVTSGNRGSYNFQQDECQDGVLYSNTMFKYEAENMDDELPPSYANVKADVYQHQEINYAAPVPAPREHIYVNNPQQQTHNYANVAPMIEY